MAEWGIILADIENNLVPNFNNDKENIIHIFKYIIELNDKEQEKKESFLDLQQTIITIDLFLHDLKEIINISDLYDTTYD